MDLARLLALTVYRAFDIDSAGRVLASDDSSGSAQLTEIQPDGTSVALTALPGPCGGRYADPADGRAVIVEHDEGGNERTQLSLLRLPLPDGQPVTLDRLEPLVHDPRFIHNLTDVKPGRICYVTNRRDGVAFDPVIRDLADGTERLIPGIEGLVSAAVLSPDGRWLAVTAPSRYTGNSTQLLLADLSAPDGQALTEVTTATELTITSRPHWLPGSDAVVFTSNRDREFTGLVRYDLATGRWTWLVTDDHAELTGWASPDGTRLLVERNDDGASRLA